MQDLSLSLVIGVVGGLIATAIVVLFRELWAKTIVPWYENRVYRDAQIEGVWRACFQGNTIADEEKVEIFRVGHAVTGTITVTKGKNEGRLYAFNGSFRNLILAATYHSRDESLLDRGTFCMQLMQNGNLLEGRCCYYSDQSKSIEQSEYVWERLRSG